MFHHLLQWHNTYVHAGPDWRSVSDGLLHVFTTDALFATVVLLWRHRHAITRGEASPVALSGGIWLGMGVFQLVDGTPFHLVLELHPVRESAAEPWPYDAAWIGSSLLLIAIGALLLRRMRG